MNKVILFLLESSVILGILYLIYYVFLRREASFNFNRFYLLGALVCALVLPLLSIDLLPEEGTIGQPIERMNDVRTSYQKAVTEWSLAPFDQELSDSSDYLSQEENESNLFLQIIMVIYGVGLVAMIFRLIWMVSWIVKLKISNPTEIRSGISLVKVPYQMAPFSFWNSVFVSDSLIDSEEFFHILEHEKTHIEQRHSFDLLIVQFLSAAFWFNPVIWWLSKSLKTTHEYIADRNMIKQGYSLVEYQSLLLRQLISNNSFGLVHNFNLSFIKKRITMMNIQKLGGLGKFKVATVITMTVLFSLIIIQCNSKLDEQDLDLTADVSVNLPLIQTDYTYDVKDDLRFDIIIKDDQIYFKDRLITLEGLMSFDGNFPDKAQMVLSIDKDQKMRLVHEVQEVLREKDLRMIVYLGEGQSGELLTVPFMLPPGKNSKSGIIVPEFTDEFIEENGITILEMNMDVKDVRYQDFVYNSLHDPMIPKGSFVFRGRFTNETSYGDYLSSLTEIKQGFYQLYDERAQEMFGKSFFDINRERNNSEEAKQQYWEVRAGFPMSIVIEII